MIKYRKNRSLRVRRILIFVLAVIVAISSFGLFFELRLRDIVVEFAKSEVKSVLINCTNRAAEKVLKDLNVTYDSLAVISRNEEGLATTVEIDAISANRLKSQISDAIATEVARYKTVSFKVPLGAAFGNYITHFPMPKFDYTVHITTTVGSNLTSKFESAGINQVLHQILLIISLESGLAVIKRETAMTTLTEFIVAQTVIVGAVPDAFTSVGHATDEVIEDIFDFGAER